MNNTDTPLTDDGLSATQRIDFTLAMLSNMELQNPDGWSINDLAEMAEVTPGAIRSREQQALAALRHHFPEDINLSN